MDGCEDLLVDGCEYLLAKESSTPRQPAWHHLLESLLTDRHHALSMRRPERHVDDRRLVNSIIIDRRLVNSIIIVESDGRHLEGRRPAAILGGGRRWSARGRLSMYWCART